MSGWRANGGYLGPRPTGPSTSAASGWWDSRSQFRNRRDGQWPTVGDPFWSDVSLLLKMNGTNGSTTFTDYSEDSLSVTRVGDAQISTAQSKFNGASALFDGVGDYLTIDATSGLTNFATADFTVEFWAYIDSYPTSGGRDFVAIDNATAGLAYSAVRITFDSTGRLALLCASGTSSWISTTQSAAGSVSVNTWHHIAATRNGSDFRLFVDGLQKLTYSSAASIRNASALTVIGGIISGGNAANFFKGYLGEMRVTRGIARYNAAFTPPASAHPIG